MPPFCPLSLSVPSISIFRIISFASRPATCLILSVALAETLNFISAWSLFCDFCAFCDICSIICFISSNVMTEYCFF